MSGFLQGLLLSAQRGSDVLPRPRARFEGEAPAHAPPAVEVEVEARGPSMDRAAPLVRAASLDPVRSEAQAEPVGQAAPVPVTASTPPLAPTTLGSQTSTVRQEEAVSAPRVAARPRTEEVVDPGPRAWPAVSPVAELETPSAEVVATSAGDVEERRREDAGALRPATEPETHSAPTSPILEKEQATLRSPAPAPRAPAPPPAEVVYRVHIGRVEVRAPQAAPQPARLEPALSLDRYLAGRKGGAR